MCDLVDVDSVAPVLPEVEEPQLMYGSSSVVLIPSPVDSDSSGEKVISGLAQDECSRKS